MFGFGFGARHRELIVSLASSLPRLLPAMHGVEKATVLVLARSMLVTASVLSASDIAANPPSDIPASKKAMRELETHRRRLLPITEDHAKPGNRHAVVHLRATELAYLTLGVAVSPQEKSACTDAWRAAWAGRDRLQDAILWIRRYEDRSGVSAVPSADPAKKQSDTELMRLGMAAVPAFLRQTRS
jgi:hypothetical protein